jgi:hypothetical protein
MDSMKEKLKIDIFFKIKNVEDDGGKEGFGMRYDRAKKLTVDCE